MIERAALVESIEPILAKHDGCWCAGDAPEIAFAVLAHVGAEVNTIIRDRDRLAAEIADEQAEAEHYRIEASTAFLREETAIADRDRLAAQVDEVRRQYTTGADLWETKLRELKADVTTLREALRDELSCFPPADSRARINAALAATEPT